MIKAVPFLLAFLLCSCAVTRINNETHNHFDRDAAPSAAPVPPPPPSPAAVHPPVSSLDNSKPTPTAVPTAAAPVAQPAKASVEPVKKGIELKPSKPDPNDRYDQLALQVKALEAMVQENLGFWKAAIGSGGSAIKQKWTTSVWLLPAALLVGQYIACVVIFFVLIKRFLGRFPPPTVR